LQLQLKLTTQEIDYLKKLKDINSSIFKKPEEEEEKNTQKCNEQKENNESLFGKSMLEVSSIHELQSFLEVVY